MMCSFFSMVGYASWTWRNCSWVFRICLCFIWCWLLHDFITLLQGSIKRVLLLCSWLYHSFLLCGIFPVDHNYCVHSPPYCRETQNGCWRFGGHVSLVCLGYASCGCLNTLLSFAVALRIWCHSCCASGEFGFFICLCFGIWSSFEC